MGITKKPGGSGKKLEQTRECLDAACEAVVKRIGKKSCLVMYSDGKESRVVLDLACRYFDQVVAIFMYWVPGLRCVEDGMDAAKARYPGLEFVQYPHWGLLQILQQGHYRHLTSPDLIAALPEWTLRDIYDLAIGDTGIPLILEGSKDADSLFKRRYLRAVQYAEVFHPVQSWQKADVFAYLASHKIPVPDSSNRSATGIDCATPAMLWLHDNHNTPRADGSPTDWEKFCEFFPLAPVVVERRRVYGIE